MITKVRYLFLSFSLIFLLGHSFVPHTHAYDKDIVQLSTCEHTPPQSLADLLTSLFLQDLGNQHLTNFKPSTDAPSVFLPLFIGSNTVFSFSENTAITEELDYLPYLEAFYQAHSLRLTGSRAPPSIMHS